MTRAHHASNRRAWNQAAIAYRRSRPQTVEFLRKGGVSMCPPEMPFLADLRSWCETAIHLQCAGGQDTLSLLNLGARKVVGIDLSEDMIEVARATSTELGAPATWICCDVLDAPAELNGTADLVYTGRGAVIWVHDLGGWAATVARLLKPGGRFYMYEGHPVTYFFDMTTSDLRLDPEFEGYFSGKVHASKGWTADYVGDVGISDDEMATKFERAWPISEVIDALLQQGLQLVRFLEHPDAYWPEFPNLPDAERTRFPNTYSVFMRKG
jgi:SAM-dependent methyltransferase